MEAFVMWPDRLFRPMARQQQQQQRQQQQRFSRWRASGRNSLSGHKQSIRVQQQITLHIRVEHYSNDCRTSYSYCVYMYTYLYNPYITCVVLRCRGVTRDVCLPFSYLFFFSFVRFTLYACRSCLTHKCRMRIAFLTTFTHGGRDIQRDRESDNESYHSQFSPNAFFTWRPALWPMLVAELTAVKQFLLGFQHTNSNTNTACWRHSCCMMPGDLFAVFLCGM